MIDPKTLKKLADTCRKAGIKHFKSADFEFSLTETLPTPKKRNTKLPSQLETKELPRLEDLTEEQILLWSVADPLAGNQ